MGWGIIICFVVFYLAIGLRKKETSRFLCIRSFVALRSIVFLILGLSYPYEALFLLFLSLRTPAKCCFLHF